MSNIPVWAMGYALRAAGVPCAEEIAMMLCRGSSYAEEPCATADYLSFSGKYITKEKYAADGTCTTSYHEFAAGEFPTTQGYSYDASAIKQRKQRGYIAMALNVGETLTTKAGDRVVIRYLRPYRINGSVGDFSVSSGRDPDSFGVEFYLNSASNVNGTKTASYKVYHSIGLGTISGYNVNNSTNCDMLTDADVQPIKDGDAVVGWEVTGTLLYPLENILVDVYAYDSLGGYYMAVSADCKSDDLQVSVYERVR